MPAPAGLEPGDSYIDGGLIYQVIIGSSDSTQYRVRLIGIDEEALSGLTPDDDGVTPPVTFDSIEKGSFSGLYGTDRMLYIVQGEVGSTEQYNGLWVCISGSYHLTT